MYALRVEGGRELKFGRDELMNIRYSPPGRIISEVIAPRRVAVSGQALRRGANVGRGYGTQRELTAISD